MRLRFWDHAHWTNVGATCLLTAWSSRVAKPTLHNRVLFAVAGGGWRHTGKGLGLGQRAWAWACAWAWRGSVSAKASAKGLRTGLDRLLRKASANNLGEASANGLGERLGRTARTNGLGERLEAKPASANGFGERLRRTASANGFGERLRRTASAHGWGKRLVGRLSRWPSKMSITIAIFSVFGLGLISEETRK